MKANKTLIVCFSTHHGNTRKVVDALVAEHEEITVVDIRDADQVNPSDYSLIGLASGIYYGHFGKPLISWAETLPAGSPVFTLYTYGAKRDGYVNDINEVLRKRNCRIAGSFGCPGYDTFGPFRLIGGIAKGHPTPTDIRQASSFYEHLKKQERIN